MNEEKNFKDLLKEEIQKQEKKENDNANANTRNDIRTDERREFGETSEELIQSQRRGHERNSSMAFGGLSDNLQTIAFRERIEQSLDGNKTQSRGTAESRLSRARTERSYIVKSTSENLYVSNKKEIWNSLSKEEKESFKKYSLELEKQKLSSYISDEKIREDISNLKKDLKYFIKKADILTLNAKTELQNKIKTQFTKLENLEKKEVIAKNTLKNIFNDKELKVYQSILNSQGLKNEK
ncbi:hypothetical protein H2274_07215 [Campylobacter sp. W0049]|uniref:hypothetical protein n=1 Tax=Campylobacter molothri TaxID=1032242 RepID=UPI00301E24EF|nr:hypothetical protein [Campylobacter sp. W0049]